MFTLSQFQHIIHVVLTPLLINFVKCVDLVEFHNFPKEIWVPHSRWSFTDFPHRLLTRQAAQCLHLLARDQGVAVGGGRYRRLQCDVKEITVAESIHFLDRPQHGGQEIRLVSRIAKTYIALVLLFAFSAFTF